MKFNKAFDLMSKGSLLMQMNKPGDASAWYLVPGGEIDEMVAQDLMKMPNVKPNDDGLFPGISQTWRVKSE